MVDEMGGVLREGLPAQGVLAGVDNGVIPPTRCARLRCGHACRDLVICHVADPRSASRRNAAIELLEKLGLVDESDQTIVDRI